MEPIEWIAGGPIPAPVHEATITRGGGRVPPAPDGYQYIYLVLRPEHEPNTCIYCGKALPHHYYTYDLHHAFGGGQDLPHPPILLLVKQGQHAPNEVPWDGRVWDDGVAYGVAVRDLGDAYPVQELMWTGATV